MLSYMMIAVVARWNYQTSSDLDGMRYAAQVSSYGGGGFAQVLGQDSASSAAIVADLSNYLWIDRATRVIFVDFTVYNANINLFCVIKWVQLHCRRHVRRTCMDGDP